MSTFTMSNDYLVPGEKYDRENGFASDEDYEPFNVEFIRAWEDGTWDTVIAQVPHPMSHEKCRDEDLVSWYMRPTNEMIPRRVVYVGVFSRFPG